MVRQQRLRACLRLTLADGVGAVLFARLTEAFGSPEAAAGASPAQLCEVEGIGRKTAEAISAVDDGRIDDELSAADACGASLVTVDDESYPAGLKAIYDPPPVLYVRGRLEPGDAVALGVVGSRRCTYYGLEQAERFGQLLGRAGFTIVSGGARGIDSAAHSGALAAGGRTIAVMGCGLSKLYPPDNAKLFDRIISDGCGAIISELPMATEIKGTNFPKRNRIISGLSLGVLIVEAARRSGSLITAGLAAEQGREVFAVPGRVDSPLSAGTNDLIRSGAVLVQSLDDVLEHLGEVGAKMSAGDQPAAGIALAKNLSETETKLLSALEAGGLSLDELVRRSGIDSGPAASAMTMLILKGLVVQRAGSIFEPKGTSPGAAPTP